MAPRENAVKTQAWVALSIYVLVAIVKKQLGLDLSLYKILQILSVTVFEKTPILEGFSNFNDGFTDAETCNQCHPTFNGTALPEYIGLLACAARRIREDRLCGMPV